MAGRRIVVKRVPDSAPKQQAASLDTLAEFCYYYPAYTFKAARQLPYPHVRRLLRRARQLQAAKYHNLLQIVAAPYSKNESQVSNLLKHYEDLMDGR